MEEVSAVFRKISYSFESSVETMDRGYRALGD